MIIISNQQNKSQSEIVVLQDKIVINNVIVQDSFITEYMRNLDEGDRIPSLVRALQIGTETLNQSKSLAIIKQINDTEANLSTLMQNERKVFDNQVHQLMNEFTRELKKDVTSYIGDANDQGKITQLFDNLYKDMELKVKAVADGTLQKFDPNTVDGIPARLAKIITKVWQEQSRAFKEIISNQNPDNPLSQFGENQLKFQQQMQMQFQLFRQEIVKQLSDLVAKLSTAEERSKGTKGGFIFQDQCLESLRTIASNSGDCIDDCSTVEGYEKSKSGDQIVRLQSHNYQVAFAVETKKTKSINNRDELKIISYLDQIAKNRGTDVSVLVVESGESIPVGVAPLKLYSDNKIVCVFNKDDSESLKIAYRVASILSSIHAKAAQKYEEIDKEFLKDTLNKLKVQINGLTPVLTSLQTISKQAETAKEEIRKYRTAVTNMLDEIQDKI